LNRFLLINMDEFDQIGINQQSFLENKNKSCSVHDIPLVMSTG